MQKRDFSICGILIFGLAFYGGFLSVQQFLNPQSKTFTINSKNLLTLPWPTELSFAGEPVPLDTFHVKERWEKEFLVALDRDYQNILYLKRARKYLPYIEQELKMRGIPDDFKYLAVAESALIDDTSISPAGAAGIWQIMPGTAKGLGLRVDDQIDERFHFEKSTQAALNYIEEIHEKFHNWTLTAAAYNVGYNKTLSRIAGQKVDNYYDLYFNPETSAYLFRILAVKEIMEYPERYGYKLFSDDYFQWPKYEVKTVGEVEDIASWAWEQGSSYRLMKELNPWMRDFGLPEGEWEVKVVQRNN